MGSRLVVGEADDLHVIDLAVGNVGGKFVAQRLFRRRVDVGIEWMHIADERALRVGKIGDCAVVRVRARKRTVLIGDETRRQIMIGQPEQAEVSPVARVIFLAVQDEDAVSTRRVRIGPEVADVRDPLFLVHDQIVDDIEVFRARLPGEIFGRVPIVAAVVHVDVKVGAAELAESGRQIVRLQLHGHDLIRACDKRHPLPPGHPHARRS